MYWNAKKAKNKLLSIWLTLTWDVLKSGKLQYIQLTYRRLTLTWDVLKYYQYQFKPNSEYGLTLTWDVLK